MKKLFNTISTEQGILVVDESSDISIGYYALKEGFADGTVKTKDEFENSKWTIHHAKDLNDLPYMERAIKGKNSQNGLLGCIKIVATKGVRLSPTIPMLVEKNIDQEFIKILSRYIDNSKEYVDCLSEIKAIQAKPSKEFSREDMIEAIQFGLNGLYGYKEGVEGTTDYQVNQFLESLKPTTIELEVEDNQCDGCNSNYPVIDGIHKVPYPSGSTGCTAHLYQRLKSEHSEEGLIIYI